MNKFISVTDSNGYVVKIRAKKIMYIRKLTDIYGNETCCKIKLTDGSCIEASDNFDAIDYELEK